MWECEWERERERRSRKNQARSQEQGCGRFDSAPSKSKGAPGLPSLPGCKASLPTELIFTLAGTLSVSFIRQIEQQLRYSYLCPGPQQPLWYLVTDAPPGAGVHVPRRADGRYLRTQ